MLSLVRFSLARNAVVASAALRAPATIIATRLHSSSSVPSINIQELVLKTAAELMQITDQQDRITLKSSLKADLGMDIFKTYQLLDRLEQQIPSVDIPIEAADKAQTLQDIFDLVKTK